MSIENMKLRIGELEALADRQARTIADLLEREENYRSLFDATNEATLIFDLQSGTVIDFTRRVQELLEFPPAKLYRRDAGALLVGEAPFTREFMWQKIRDAAAGMPQIFEAQSHSYTGKSVWLEVYLKRCRIFKEKRVIALLKDIEERKRNEISLRERELYYRSVFENTGTATFIKEADMTLSMVNSGFERLTGYAKDEVQGQMKWMQIIHPDDRERLNQYHSDRRSGRQAPTEIQCRLVDRRGRIKEVFLKVDLIPGTKRSIGSFIDLSGIKKAEQAVQEKEARIQAVIEAFEGLIYASSKDYRVVYINERYTRMLGRDVTGEQCYKALHGRDDVCPFCVQEQVQKGETVRFEVKNPQDNRWYHSVNSPIHHVDGRISLLALVTDIHDRKEAEVALRENALHLQEENRLLRGCIKERYRFGRIVGKSQPMQAVYEKIVNAAATDANVIVYGESGTGKELVAHAIHDMSGRHDKPFVTVNCGAIPEKLLESEFFGYCKGAFTGAVKDKPGYLDLADGGTLFLDELGEINLSLQVKLLRVIEGHGFMPVGGDREHKANTRIIAATNRDLSDLVNSGGMRQDFYYRINVIPIQLPRLRERKDDLPLLIDHFLRMHGANGDTPPITGQMIETLQRYDWPGNVRELENVLLRYISLKKLDLSGLRMDQPPTAPGLLPDPAAGQSLRLKDLVADLERRVIEQSLVQHQWHKSRVATLLGIDRKTLNKKIRSYGLSG
jgi:PAS domain S-box-containing protein